MKENTEKNRYIIFECLGDLNKNKIATTVTHSLKIKHPEKKIIVVTTFPEVWLHNPDVYRTYKIGRMSFFYDDYIKDRESLIFKHDPEATTDFIYKTKDIIDIWCDLCDTTKSINAPQLYFTFMEKEAITQYIRSGRDLNKLNIRQKLCAEQIINSRK